MRSFLRWTVIFFLAALAVLFAWANDQDISFTYNPFQEPVILPLYTLSLGMAAAGFILGAISAWLGMYRVRKDLKDAKKTIKTKEKELSEVKNALSAAQKSQNHTSLPLISTENPNLTDISTL